MMNLIEAKSVLKSSDYILESKGDIIIQNLLNTLVTACELYISHDYERIQKAYRSARAQTFLSSDPIILPKKTYTKSGMTFTVPPVMFMMDKDFKQFNHDNSWNVSGVYESKISENPKVSALMDKFGVKKTWAGVVIITEQTKFSKFSKPEFLDVFRTNIRMTLKHELLHYVQGIAKRIAEDRITPIIEEQNSYILNILKDTSIVYDNEEVDSEDEYTRYMLKSKEIDARFHQEITTFLVTRKIDPNNLEDAANKFISTYIWKLEDLPEKTKTAIYNRLIFILEQCKELGLFEKVTDEDGDEEVKIKQIYREKGDAALWNLIGK